MRQPRKELCYLCRTPLRKHKLATGETTPPDQRTRDHIPPECLFPEPKPTDLITIPCCYRCNQSFSDVDEQFRAFVTAAVNVSATGKNVLRGKVFGRSLKKPSFRKQIQAGLFLRTLDTNSGPVSVPMITMDRAALEPFFTRLTKGLLTKFYPKIDHFDLIFEVKQINQFGAFHPRFRQLTAHFRADQRGDGVFRFWHFVRANEGRAGIWLFQFYDAALFQVAHAESKALLSVSDAD